MDTASQFLKQQQKQQAQDPAQQPVQPNAGVPQNVQPVPPVQPVGSVQKEAGPLAPVSEYIQQSEKTPVLEQEVKDAGVTTVENPDIPKLHVDVKNTGLTVSGEAMQLQHAQAASSVQLPYTQQQILEAEKAPVVEGKKWLAYIYELLSKRFGFWKTGVQVKEGGKV